MSRLGLTKKAPKKWEALQLDYDQDLITVQPHLGLPFIYAIKAIRIVTSRSKLVINMRKPITLLILIMAHVPLLMGKRNRHNRDAAKKPDKGHCASDFCLPNNYNSLELPSSDKQIVAINLEVNKIISSGATFVRASYLFNSSYYRQVNSRFIFI